MKKRLERNDYIHFKIIDFQSLYFIACNCIVPIPKENYFCHYKDRYVNFYGMSILFCLVNSFKTRIKAKMGICPFHPKDVTKCSCSETI